MELDLPLIWAFLIAFAVLAYVILDGFDLGIGILFTFLAEGRERDIAMNSVAPVWDGNETWLVLGGGGLMAAFPLAYATVLPALYAPLTAMLLGLVLRGVAFEFRWKTVRGQFLWDGAFAVGSVMAAFCQGIALGALVQGIAVENRAYAGGWWDWLTPFSILTGLAVVFGYALLGSCWLFLKTTGDIEAHARRWSRRLAIITIIFIGMVSLITPLLDPRFAERWFGWPNMILLAPVPLMVMGAFVLLWRGLDNGRPAQPFLAALGLFVLCFAGLGISLFPYVVPPDITIRDAAAPDESLGFMLVGAVVLIPLILAYTAYAYWVFRGKIDPEEGYHT